VFDFGDEYGIYNLVGSSHKQTQVKGLVPLLL